jgi:hypothetical protein
MAGNRTIQNKICSIIFPNKALKIYLQNSYDAVQNPAFCYPEKLSTVEKKYNLTNGNNKKINSSQKYFTL